PLGEGAQGVAEIPRPGGEALWHRRLLLDRAGALPASAPRKGGATDPRLADLERAEPEEVLRAPSLRSPVRDARPQRAAGYRRRGLSREPGVGRDVGQGPAV